MGKLKDLAMVKSTDTATFAYLPPDTAFDAMRILVKPQLLSSAVTDKTVRLSVLEAVLRGLRRASPLGRIVVVDGIVDDARSDDVFAELGVTRILDDEMRITHADNMVLHTYHNFLPDPGQYEAMRATEYIKDYPCIISVGVLDVLRVAGGQRVVTGLDNLMGIFPQARYGAEFMATDPATLLKDIYFSVGYCFHGSVIDLHGPGESDEHSAIDKVVWGDDLLVVDQVACQMAGLTPPAYLEEIKNLRETVLKR